MAHLREDKTHIKNITEVTPELQPLAEEARKYKSVEEFEGSIPVVSYEPTIERIKDAGFKSLTAFYNQVKEKAIFIRKETKAESRGGAPRQKALRNIPKKIGYEAVYKPYGLTGKREDAGYYYKKKNCLKHVDIQKYIIQDVKHYRARVQGEDWRFETESGETLDMFRARIMDTLDCGIVTHFIEDWKPEEHLL